MICLAYEDGRLVEKTGEPWGDYRVRQYAKHTASQRDAMLADLMLSDRLTRRERRRLARHGRRFPVRVSVHREMVPRSVEIRLEELVAHRMYRKNPFTGRYAPQVPEHFLLYLRADESVDEPRHLDAFIEWTDALHKKILWGRP